MFWKRKINSDEYEKLSKRITDLEVELDKFTGRFMSLRGLIHRKATGDFELRDSKDEIPSIDDGMDELRKLNKASSST